VTASIREVRYEEENLVESALTWQDNGLGISDGLQDMEIPDP